MNGITIGFGIVCAIAGYFVGKREGRRTWLGKRRYYL